MAEKPKYDVLRTFVSFHRLCISLKHQTRIIGCNYVPDHEILFLSSPLVSVLPLVLRQIQEDSCIRRGIISASVRSGRNI
jgi:hypothetical protein